MEQRLGLTDERGADGVRDLRDGFLAKLRALKVEATINNSPETVGIDGPTAANVTKLEVMYLKSLQRLATVAPKAITSSRDYASLFRIRSLPSSRYAIHFRKERCRQAMCCQGNGEV